MTIRYSDGRAFEAAPLSRTEATIRAAVEGADGAPGTWPPPLTDLTDEEHPRRVKLTRDTEPHASTAFSYPATGASFTTRRPPDFHP